MDENFKVEAETTEVFPWSSKYSISKLSVMMKDYSKKYPSVFVIKEFFSLR